MSVPRERRESASSTSFSAASTAPSPRRRPSRRLAHWFPRTVRSRVRRGDRSTGMIHRQWATPPSALRRWSTRSRRTPPWQHKSMLPRRDLPELRYGVVVARLLEEIEGTYAALVAVGANGHNRAVGAAPPGPCSFTRMSASETNPEHAAPLVGDGQPGDPALGQDRRHLLQRSRGADGDHVFDHQLLRPPLRPERGRAARARRAGSSSPTRCRTRRRPSPACRRRPPSAARRRSPSTAT